MSTASTIWLVLVGFVLVTSLARKVRSGAFSSDRDIRRLANHDWLTSDEHERHFIRRDAAEVLTSSRNPRARANAAASLLRKPNIAVLDTCADEVFAGIKDSDGTTAQTCAQLIRACVQDALSISRAGYISGVGINSDSAERYRGRLAQVLKTPALRERRGTFWPERSPTWCLISQRTPVAKTLMAIFGSLNG